jgi:hypothetical protein
MTANVFSPVRRWKQSENLSAHRAAHVARHRDDLTTSVIREDSKSAVPTVRAKPLRQRRNCGILCTCRVLENRVSVVSRVLSVVDSSITYLFSVRYSDPTPAASPPLHGADARADTSALPPERSGISSPGRACYRYASYATETK